MPNDLSIFDKDDVWNSDAFWKGVIPFTRLASASLNLDYVGIFHHQKGDLQLVCANSEETIALFDRDAWVVKEALESSGALLDLAVRPDTPLSALSFLSHFHIQLPSRCESVWLILANNQPVSHSTEQEAMLDQLIATVSMKMRLALLAKTTMLEKERRKQQNRTLKKRGRELARHKKELDFAAKLSKVGAWSVDLKTNKVRWDKQVREIHQVSPTYTPTLKKALSFYDTRAQDEVAMWLRVAVETSEPFRFELPITTAKKERRWISSIGEVEQENGKPVRINGCIQDVTERREAENEIARLTTRDHLTALPNRRVFRDKLHAAIGKANERGKAAGLLVIDVDDFKSINDKDGHEVGDRVLRAVAHAISVNVRKSDTVSRLGGDEFAVVLSSCSKPEDVETIGQRLTNACTKLDVFDAGLPDITVAIGAAVAPRDGETVDELVKAADIALQSAKSSGRDRLAWYEPAMGARVSQKYSVLSAVREGLASKQFTAAYQPKVNFTDMSLCGAEALARWDHPEKGLLPPGAFIEALQDPKLAAQISDTVLDTVLSDAAHFRVHEQLGGPIAINTTEAQIVDPGFPDLLLRKLQDWNLPPSAIMVEVTEDVFLGEHDANVLRNMTHLRECGISIALDDFGTGFASLSHLMKFPVDSLKVDRSFIINLDSDEQSYIITSAVINMAHGLGMSVVAEGIEGPGAEGFLKRLGCDYGQGYYYARPVRLDELLDYLKEVEAGEDEAGLRLAATG